MELVPYPTMDLSGPIELHLFGGCCLEADRSDTAGFQLEKLRAALTGNTQHLTTTIQEIRLSGGLLRELVDFSQVHQDRVPTLLNFLNVLLPCISRSLRDILMYSGDRSFTRKNRWRGMYRNMATEADGLPLPQRFALYNYFLRSVREVLIRSPGFDMNGLENARHRILKLREKRGIPPPPSDIGPAIHAAGLPFDLDPVVHWAEKIFTLPLPSRTIMKRTQASTSAGPHQLWGQIWVSEGSKILYRQIFNNDEISLIVYEDGFDRSPYFLIRVMNMEVGGAWYSRRGAHELCMEREGSCLRLKRWSRRSNCSKTWAVLNFATLEELVLTMYSFLVLKARSDLTIGMRPEEFCLDGDRILFTARISDDGFWHTLMVIKDVFTGGIRLHAAVWDGKLQNCPVWTAFVTHQSTAEGWVKRISRRRARLFDVQLYVFCQTYRQHKQRRGNAGAFEIYFHSEEACSRFVDLFTPRTTTSRGKMPMRY